MGRKESNQTNKPYFADNFEAKFAVCCNHGLGLYKLESVCIILGQAVLC